MNQNVMRVIKWLAALFIAFYLGAQLYSALINPVTTDTVYTHSSFTGYSTQGYIIRNETVIDQNVDGALGYEVENGGRVSKKGTIANVYIGSSEAEKKVQIEQLEKKIASLENIQSYNDLNAADIDALKINIHNSLISVMQSTQNGRIENADTSTEKLLADINRYQIITGKVSDFNGLINSLKAQKNALSASAVPPIDSIKSPESGYVIYSVDGYENVIVSDDVSTLTAEKMQSIAPKEISGNKVCKIVSDYEWHIAVQMPFGEVLNLKEGSTVTLKTALLSSPELKVTVKHINKQSVQENAVVVFACNTMNTELASIRWLDLTVVYEQYDGLKVDNRAIRVVDGVKGVYVLTASQVKFVPVSVLWAGDNYSIVARESADKTVLRVYDEIIVKGKNLYDGKIID